MRRGVNGEADSKVDWSSFHEGGKPQVHSEAHVGISIKREKDQSRRDLWYFSGLGYTFANFFSDA